MRTLQAERCYNSNTVHTLAQVQQLPRGFNENRGHQCGINVAALQQVNFPTVRVSVKQAIDRCER
jgi:hypothetical protein